MGIERSGSVSSQLRNWLLDHDERLRLAVLARDGGQCAVCGGVGADHVVAVDDELLSLHGRCRSRLRGMLTVRTSSIRGTVWLEYGRSARPDGASPRGAPTRMTGTTFRAKGEGATPAGPPPPKRAVLREECPTGLGPWSGLSSSSASLDRRPCSTPGERRLQLLGRRRRLARRHQQRRCPKLSAWLRSR